MAVSDETDDQVERLIQELKRLKGVDVEAKIGTQNGFLGWLRSLGLQTLANKLANSSLWDQLWSALTSFFDFIADSVGDILDLIMGLFA